MFKRLLPIFLLAFTYVIGQLYMFWEDDTRIVNWIIDCPTPMLIKWNVKFLSEEVNRIIEAVAILVFICKIEKLSIKRFSENIVPPIFKLAFIEYLLYRCLDILYYFWNYKTTRYFFVFLILGIIMAIIYNKKRSVLNHHQ